MGLQLSQDAVVYILIMLVVIFVGVYFILGADISKLVNFGREEKFTINLSGNINCENGKYVASVTIDIFNYNGPPEDISFIPILDIGNNPLWDNGKTIIKCTYDDSIKHHNCGQQRTMTYVLSETNVKDRTFLDHYVNTDIIIFEDSESLRSYLKLEKNAYTTEKMVSEFTDWYKITKGFKIAPPGCLATFSKESCKDLDVKICQEKVGCYLDMYANCATCPANINKCSYFNNLIEACEKCPLSDGSRCKAMPTGRLITCIEA